MSHIEFIEFAADDVVRHPVVGAIINAYDAFDAAQEKAKEAKEKKD